MSTYIPKKITINSKKHIDAMLLKLFYVDFQPFSVVEDAGFRKYTKALNPSYEIPSRQVISRTHIPSLYEQCLNDCKELVKDVVAISLTTDCWTSVNNESFMGVTIHFLDKDFKMQTMLLECAVFDISHTSINLSEKLKEITDEWGIEKKIMLAVSDNASNIKNAIKNELGWRYFACFSHTLNLIVRDALSSHPLLFDTIEKVKTIVSHFKRSSKATAKLNSYQESTGAGTPKKLIQDVVTRWNSTYLMIQRFIELEEAIRSTVALLDTTLPQLTLEEWQLLKQLRIILEPFENATCVISGQKYLVASLVIVITNGLLNVCHELLNREMSSIAKMVIKKLQSGIKERLGNIEYSNTLAMATFMDPRFKVLVFVNNDAVERVKKNVIAELADVIYKKDLDQTKSKHEEADEGNVNEKDNSESKDNKLSIWFTLDKIAREGSSKTPNKSSTAKAIMEIQRYLDDDILDRKRDPLEWWRKSQYMYPNLSFLVRKKLCAVATSVPCESLFSKAGQLLCDRRNRLKSNKVHKLLFLNYNHNFCI